MKAGRRKYSLRFKLKKTLVVLSDKLLDLVCRGQGVSDGNVVV